jgi:predicted lipoprotein with Yx(FWY)xxD motif
MNIPIVQLKRAALPALTIGVLALAGCGSNGSSQSTATTRAGQSSGTVVTVSNETGRSVLVTASGRALYFSDQEKGKVLCNSGACQAIWTPLTTTSKQTIVAAPSLDRRIGTVGRPDGTTQVTLAGRPLYTFSFDHGAGQVNGDGEHDSFDGTDFTWHVATPSARAAAAAPTSPSSPATSSTPYSSGGYSY